MPFKDLRKLKPEVHDVNDYRGRPDPNFHGSGPIDLSANIKRVGNTNQDPALLDLYQKGPLKSVGWDKVCGQCLAPDTPITTGNGVKPISEVKVDDLVLTHLGRYRRVLKVASRQYAGDLVTLGVQGKGTISLTPEHPVYARHLGFTHRKLRMQMFAWVEAGKLDKKEFSQVQELLVLPRTRQIENPQTIPFDVRYKNAPRHMEIPITQELMIIAGYYLAEGSVLTGRGRGQHRIVFTFGHNLYEHIYVKELTDAFIRMGLNSRVDFKLGILKVSVDSAWLARFIAQEFGVKSYGKKVPLWARLLPPEYAETLLKCYLNGDGHQIERGHYVGATVSYQLAHAVRELALKLGYNASVYQSKVRPRGVILGRKVNLHQQWAFRIFDRTLGYRNAQRGDSDNLYVRIQKLERVPYSGLVYNLEVEEDNSYCTTLFAVHNCIYFYRDPNLTNKRHGRCRAYGFKEVHEELTAEVKHNYTEPDGQITFGLWPGCDTWTSRDRLMRK